MQLSQEIFNILKGANIKLKLFDPAGNKTLDPERSARFYAYDKDFLVTIREEDDLTELVVQAGASFNFNEHKDLLDSIKKAGHNAMAEYNIRKFDKNIEPKDFAHDVVNEEGELITRLKELSGIKTEEKELTEYRSRRNVNWDRSLPEPDPKKYPANKKQYGPIATHSGRVIYYNPGEGNYSDGDTGKVLTYDEWNEAEMPPQGADIEGSAPVPKYGLASMHPQLDKDKEQWSLEMWAGDMESRMAGLTDEANTEHKTKLKNDHPDIYAKAVEMYPDFALEQGPHPFRRMDPRDPDLKRQRGDDSPAGEFDVSKIPDGEPTEVPRDGKTNNEIGDKNIFNSESTEEELTEFNTKAGEGHKTIKVNKDVELAGDSIWLEDEMWEADHVTVGDITVEQHDDGWYEVHVEHNGPWEIYTDKGFEAGISKIVGRDVKWSEQGMQASGVAHLEAYDMKEAVGRLKELAGVKLVEEEKQYGVWIAGAKVHQGWVTYDDAEKIVQKYRDSGKWRENAFEIRPVKDGERQKIIEAGRDDVTHAQLLPHIKNVRAAIIKHTDYDPEDYPDEGEEFVNHLDDMMDAGDMDVVDMMQPDYMDTQDRDSLIYYFQVSISKDPALFNVLFPGENIAEYSSDYSKMFESNKTEQDEDEKEQHRRDVKHGLYGDDEEDKDESEYEELQRRRDVKHGLYGEEAVTEAGELKVSFKDFMSWFFSQEEDYMGFAQEAVDTINREGSVTYTPQDMLDRAGYVPGHLVQGATEEQEDEEFDPSEITLVESSDIVVLSRFGDAIVADVHDKNDKNHKIIMEGYSRATGSIKTSYIQLPEATKLIIRHSAAVNEEKRGARSRNIKALFVENSAGERFRFPFKYLQGARAMANHVSHGGTPYDAIGESIIKLSEEVSQCTQFLRHVRSHKLVNEGNENIVETIKEKLKEFKSTVKRLQTSRGYNAYQAQSTAIVEENDKEAVDITDKFMYNTFKTANMDAVLETVARIVKEKDSMTDLTKTNINRVYDMIKDKEDFQLNIDPNDPEHPDNEDPIKYSGEQGAMAKLVSMLSYLAMNSKNDEVFNLLSQISSELYNLPNQHVIMMAKIVKYLDQKNKVPAKEKEVETENIAETILTGLRRKVS